MTLSIQARKSPRQQRSRQTVEVVLEAAAQVLEGEGLAGFNTNAIAARAGVSVGSIYQYFPDKSAVLAALSRREAARFSAALASALETAAGQPMPMAVDTLVDSAVAHQTARPHLAAILDLEERRLGIEAEAAAATETAISQLRRFLEDRGVPDAATAARDSLNLARGMIDGALADEPADLTRRISRAVLGYLSSA